MSESSLAMSSRADEEHAEWVRPHVSVVVPSVNGSSILLECLGALRANVAADVTLEILVVNRCGEAVRHAVAQHFPEARVLPVAPTATIPQMRAVAFGAARGDAVAVIEDHVLVPPEWARQLLEALADGHDVVGGSVTNGATTRTVDWAAFLCEYSHLLPSVAAAHTAVLAGNNVVYRRTVLEKYSAAFSEGRWEDYLHAVMRRDGVLLRCRPEIRVVHKMQNRAREYLSQRYLYARGYAGLRAAKMGAARRGMFALATLLLPVLLLFRIVGRVWVGRVHRPELARSLPLLVLFVCAGAFGETVGYALGPGEALSKVK